MLSVLGFGGVAIGFAFKDIFQNLIAGIFLLIRQPFAAGDEIRSGDITGKVEAIKTRATYIRTYDGKRVIVPNSIIYTEPVTVITAYECCAARSISGSAMATMWTRRAIWQ